MGKWLPDPEHRTTSDTVVLMLALVVMISIFSMIIGSFVVTFFNPTTDIGTLMRYLTDLTSTIVGALIGFIGGRATGKKEGP